MEAPDCTGDVILVSNRGMLNAEYEIQASGLEIDAPGCAFGIRVADVGGVKCSRVILIRSRLKIKGREVEVNEPTKVVLNKMKFLFFEWMELFR